MVTEKQLILETTGSHLPKSWSPEQVAGPAFLRASTVSAVSYQIMFNNPISSTKKMELHVYINFSRVFVL